MTKIFTIFIIAFALLTSESKAQQFSIGEKSFIFSKILNENREIWIHLPKSYFNENIKPATYPVVYLLDAEINFNYFATMVDFLSKEPYADIPEMIVVGITNTDRTRDLTPTKSSKQSPFNKKEKLFVSSGGNDIFLQFLQTELKPFINKNYRTKNFEIFVGHSFGGLAVMNCFLKHPEYFNAYVANDPSLWWDNEVLNKEFEKEFPGLQKQWEKKFLYVAQAHNPKENQSWNSDMIQGIENFKKLTKDYSPKFYFQTKYYDHDDHGTVSFPANYDALKFIFQGFKTDIKKVLKFPELLDASYKQFSLKTGVDFQPSETYLKLISDFMKKNKTNLH